MIENKELTIEERQALEKELNELIPQFSENNLVKKSAEDKDKAMKARLTELFKELGLNSTKCGDVTVSMSEIDKTYLEEAGTIAYLKAHELNDLIRTKEYFEYSEIIMAANRNRINLAELQQFIIPKTETRINIKRAKVAKK